MIPPLYPGVLQKQWHAVGAYPHHGICTPLFSLTSENSWGIGEIPDLKLLVDWAAHTGFDLIQLLPLTHTGLDTSPYGAISAFALHPIYLGMSQLPFLEESPTLCAQLREGKPHTRRDRVEYGKIRRAKETFFRAYLQVFQTKLLKSQEMEQFLQNSAFWMEGYLRYRLCQRKWAGTSWSSWPSPLPPWTEEDTKERDALLIEQYLLHLQLQEAHSYATQKGVRWMADVPILLAKESADVFSYPHLFDTALSAGAPPDLFNPEGQNWQFPLYRWDALEESGFLWWKERLRWMGQYANLYRLDHIVGFFRIWAIATGHSAKEGFFSPKEELLWVQNGYKHLLPLIQSSPLLPIGEDLGQVPARVRATLHALGIPGTKVMRWERDWEGDQAFFPLNTYPRDSLSTVSTHDTESLAGWWKHFPQEASFLAQTKGWAYEPQLNHTLRKELLWDSHHTSSFFHVNLLQEYLSLIPAYGWEDPDQERINRPGVISEKNWSLRYRPSLEELLQNQGFVQLIKNILF